MDAETASAAAAAGSASTFQCSPALHRKDGETCLPPSALERLRRNWNKTHPRNKIVLRETRKNGRIRGGAGAGASTSASAGGLYTQLRNAMKNHYKCDTEYCMVKKIPGTTDEKKSMLSYFRPEKPKSWDKKPSLWLDSYNIEDVMNQYEKANPKFEFIGPVPIDFDSEDNWGRCIVNELCKLNVEDMKKKGKTKIGIIFNLDPHDEPGSHWVCAFVDIEGSSAYYFDSYGFKPEKEIQVFLARMKSQGIEHIYYNDIRHQKKGSECGMYCLFTIICLLRGRSFYDICTHVTDDDTMNKFRDILFAEEKPRREAIEEGLKKMCK
jgi:hypothetical protein